MQILESWENSPQLLHIQQYFIEVGVKKNKKKASAQSVKTALWRLCMTLCKLVFSKYV